MEIVSSLAGLMPSNRPNLCHLGQIESITLHFLRSPLSFLHLMLVRLQRSGGGNELNFSMDCVPTNNKKISDYIK